jgi:lipoate-protein ligase A
MVADSGYILEVESAAFSSELDVEVKERKVSRTAQVFHPKHLGD